MNVRNARLNCYDNSDKNGKTGNTTSLLTVLPVIFLYWNFYQTRTFIIAVTLLDF
jgi:hypothetical protein